MPAPGFRRIVVALDASAHSVAALEVAARLARTLEAELVGIYVEDLELVRVAQLPFALEIDFFSGRPRRIRSRGIERQLAHHAGRAREALRRVAERLELRWSFHTVRGRPAVELGGFAAETDLVTLGTRGRSMGRGLGSTTRALVGRAGMALMIVERGARAGKAVHVLHDGAPVSDEAVLVAAALQPAGERRLVVLTAEDPEAVRSGVAGRLEEAGLSAELRVRPLDARDPRAIARAMSEGGASVLVAPRSAVGPEGAALPALLRYGRRPVLVVG